MLEKLSSSESSDSHFWQFLNGWLARHLRRAEASESAFIQTAAVLLPSAPHPGHRYSVVQRTALSVDCQGRRIKGFEGARAPPEHETAPSHCQKHPLKMKRKTS